jgi:nucleoside-diphosphate-sugar epimerase
MSEDIILIGSSGVIGSHIKSFFEPDSKISDFKFHDWTNLQHFRSEIKTFLRKLPGKSLIVIWVAGSVHPRSPSKDINENAKIFELFVEIIGESKFNYNDIKIIFLSSTGSIYPYNSHKISYENSPTTPTSEYGVMKLHHERLLFDLANYENINCVILRSPSVFGSAKFKNTGIVNQIRFNIDFEIKVNLDTRRQYIHIQDLCLTIEKAIYFSQFSGYLIKNISPPQSYSIYELIMKYGNENLISRAQLGGKMHSELINQSILVGSHTAKELDLEKYTNP